MRSMLKKFKKNNQKIEYICPLCKTTEFIPKDVVEHFDRIDSVGVDNSYPPRFDCENCNGLMVPVIKVFLE